MNPDLPIRQAVVNKAGLAPAFGHDETAQVESYDCSDGWTPIPQQEGTLRSSSEAARGTVLGSR